MNIMADIKKTETTFTSARTDDHIVRVYGAPGCPFCFRRLCAGDLRETGVGFAWTCGGCHHDILVVAAD